MCRPPEEAAPAPRPSAEKGDSDSAAALAGRRALVTGASSGIGFAISGALARAGAFVWLVARGEGRLRKAAAEVGGVALPADVADADAVERLRERLARGVGGSPDIVVSAAGAFALASVERTPLEAFDRMLAVNLRAPFLLTRAFLPAMLERGSGHLVTIGSVAGRVALPHNGAYSATKFGVRGLHAVLDAELRGSGVRATLVEPAATDTPLWDTVDPTRHPGIPPRAAMLAPAAVAEAVVFALTRPPEVDVRTILLERT